MIKGVSVYLFLIRNIRKNSFWIRFRIIGISSSQIDIRNGNIFSLERVTKLKNFKYLQSLFLEKNKPIYQFILFILVLLMVHMG